eukprot:109673_1
MTSVSPWITDYITAYLGKQCVTQPDWDPQRSRLVQIVGRKKRASYQPESSGLTLVMSDGEVQINCKIIPQILAKYNSTAFEKNAIIHLNTIELRIVNDLSSLYFLAMDCTFSSSIPVVSVGQNKSIKFINSLKSVQRLLNKYRATLSHTFPPDPDDPHPGFDSNHLPYSLHSAQESFELETDTDSLHITSTVATEPWRNKRLENGDLNELCGEQEDNREQKDTNKNKSDKEEMEDEPIETNTFIANTCDWLSDLYPNPNRIPKVLKRGKQPMIKPQHGTLNDDASPIKKTRIVTEYKEDVRDGDGSSGSQNYSQASWTSTDVLQCDLAVKHKQREKELQSEFVKPTYSLTERYKTKENVNDSIVSIQESVASDVDQNHNTKDDSGIIEMDELLASEDDMETNETVEAPPDAMNEPINRNYLGLITPLDLQRIRRYFIKIGEELNAENNCDPNNPFRG